MSDNHSEDAKLHSDNKDNTLMNIECNRHFKSESI